MRSFLIILLTTMISVPAMAQEKAADQPEQGASSIPVQAEPSAANLELAKQMHKIWPVRTRVEAAIDVLAKQFPADKQLQVKSSVRKSIQFDQIEEESIRAMANTFTEEELKAMIAFYGSDVGRSVSAKTSDYEQAMRPIIVKMLDKAMLDLKTGLAR